MTNRENNFLVEEDRGVCTVRLGDVQELDLGYSQRLFDTVVGAAGDTACRAVVVDLSGATFMDCSALSAIARAHTEAEKQHKPFVLDVTEVAKPSILRLIDLTQVGDQLFIARKPASSSPGQARS